MPRLALKPVLNLLAAVFGQISQMRDYIHNSAIFDMYVHTSLDCHCGLSISFTATRVVLSAQQ